METPNDTATNNDNNQHATTAATIVTNLTTATPVTSEIVSDFEPDPKFEITPLERASYDALSQASVDAQMEKVIDNIVELGGVHPFSQNLGQAEDKEKLLETIHREITSERSSIDLIADVASQQKSIEIHPSFLAEQQTTSERTTVEPCASLEQLQPIPDLKNLIAESLDEQQSTNNQAEPIIDNPEVVRPMSGIGETKDDFNHSDAKATAPSEDEPKKEDGPTIDETLKSNNNHSASQDDIAKEPEPEEEIVAEVLLEPIVEEPLAPVEGEEATPEKSKTEDEPPEQERVFFEFIQTAKDTAQEMHLEPVVEEPVSTDDETQPNTVKSSKDKMRVEVEEANAKATVEFEPEARTEAQTSSPNEETRNVATPEEPEPSTEHPLSKKVVNEKIELQAQPKSPDAAVRRRSDRKVKPVERIQPEITTRKSRRSEKTEKLKEEQSTDPVQGAEIEKVEVVVVEAGKQDQEDALPSDDVPKLDLDEPPKMDVEPDSEEAVKVETEHTDTSSKQSQQERLPRALRPRESLKRGHDEELPAEQQRPKVESHKKQIKRPRSSTHDKAASLEAPRDAPTIKLPNYKSRSTISASDPISRLNENYESSKNPELQPISEKRFVCHQCDYATDRLNNLVYHSIKSFCKGKCQAAEVMKADITRQQQQSKAKRRSIR